MKKNRGKEHLKTNRLFNSVKNVLIEIKWKVHSLHFLVFSFIFFSFVSFLSVKIPPTIHTVNESLQGKTWFSRVSFFYRLCLVGKILMQENERKYREIKVRKSDFLSIYFQSRKKIINSFFTCIFFSFPSGQIYPRISIDLFI